MKWINEQIKVYDGQNAIIINDQVFSYSQLSKQISKYYKLLIDLPGSRNKIFAVISDYCFESIAFFFALFENNNIIVPITSRIENEIKERINITNTDYVVKIINNTIIINSLDNDSDTNPLVYKLQTDNHAGLILFSSGSTGTPKAMIHNLDNLVDTYQNKKGKNLTFLIFLMFDHIGGLNTLLNCIAIGVTMVFPSIRDPEHICSLIEQYKINVLPASPTFLNLILISESYNKHDLSSLRLVTYGTEPMPENLLLRLKDIFPRVKFLQTFGTSETGIAKVSSKSSESTYLKFDDPNTEYKIVNNELWLRTKTQILGYINSSMERFTDDGWFKTGDVVEEIEDNYIKIIGRSQEIINVGGEKVLPSEIESVLFQIPELVDCIVYGEKNIITGQIVVAKVLLKNQDNLSTLETKKIITKFCKGKLDNFKIPAKVVKMNKSEYSERFKKNRIASGNIQH